MVTIEECILKAENYALAAQAASTPDEQRLFIRLAGIYRNRALRLKLGEAASDYLKPNPLAEKLGSHW
ncbi:MAG TPA: hypothetical protein VFV70_02355 [Hyphomonadaceae bacterium]|nr:hypothetical protein [Hyphomonadaceae bacterium]